MTENREPKIGGILLAAGGSSRLGYPKQLVEFQGKTLIHRAAETLVDSQCDPIVVVLGAETHRSAIELNGLDINICVNDNWQTGMSSSIMAGLRSLLETEPKLDAVVITLCDQPYVNSADIDKLITAFAASHPAIVAAKYDKTIGVPALFSSKFFDDLTRLEGDKGAKDLIKNEGDVVTIDLATAVFDIDLRPDLDILK